jgi:translation initiation factor IF-1
MFGIQLDNEDLIIGSVSERIRPSFIHILTKNRIRIEVDRYDSTKGHINL